MLKKLVKYFSKQINKGSARSGKMKKNVMASYVFRGLNIILSFIALPIALNYVDKSIYGIWLIISSLLGWMDVFDIGLGNGLRNKFAIALAQNDKVKARIYVSTTYFILSLIIIALLIVFFIINPFLNWVNIFNAPEGMHNELSNLMYVVFGFYCFQFVIKLIITILIADQRPAIRDAVFFISKFFNVSIIYILSKTTEGSLFNLGLVYSVVPVLILIITSIYYYLKDYRDYIPSFKYVEMKYARNLMSLGIKFFIIQIAVMVLYATDNIIITQLFNPAEVTTYNVAHKYFGVILMSFTIFITPFWSTATEAYHKKDIKWIKKAVKVYIYIWLGHVIVAMIMLICSNWVYDIWLGGKIIVPFGLSLVWAIYVLMQSFNSIFVNFINGVGKISLQIYTALFSIVFNIPLSVLFAKYCGLGTAGVLLATLVSTVLSLVLRPLQYYKIINNKAKGIWNK